MKTKFILTVDNPDKLDDFSQLDVIDKFTDEAKARERFARFVNGGTNMHAYLLRVELLDDAQGRLAPLPKSRRSK